MIRSQWNYLCSRWSTTASLWNKKGSVTGVKLLILLPMWWTVRERSGYSSLGSIKACRVTHTLQLQNMRTITQCTSARAKHLETKIPSSIALSMFWLSFLCIALTCVSQPRSHGFSLGEVANCYASEGRRNRGRPRETWAGGELYKGRGGRWVLPLGVRLLPLRQNVWRRLVNMALFSQRDKDQWKESITLGLLWMMNKLLLHNIFEPGKSGHPVLSGH